MPCEREWPTDGPPVNELPGMGPELVLAFPDGCRACGSMDLRVEMAGSAGLDEDVHSLAELAKYPAEIQAWLRCASCRELDHRRHRPASLGMED